MKVYNKSVADWFLGQQHFCLTLAQYVARSLRAADSFSGRTKLLLSSNQANNCKLTILQLYLYIIFKNSDTDSKSKSSSIKYLILYMGSFDEKTQFVLYPVKPYIVKHQSI